MGKAKWPDLHHKPTVTSLHHSVHAPTLARPPPSDSLDNYLLSCYQHNLELFSELSDTMRHPSRFVDPLQLTEKATSKAGELPTQTIVHGGIRVRPSIHSVKLGIGANHIAQTNAGYSRKVDGTFYNL